VIFTKIGIALGIFTVAGLFVLAAIGFSPATPLLVTTLAIVVLVAGGNWLSGRGTPRTYSAPPPVPQADEGVVNGEEHDA
jgi:hypothetical protein